MAAISLSTEDKLSYEFRELQHNYIQFRVKARNDAHIALAPEPSDEAIPMWEIFIGGWQNSKSVIRKNRTKPDKVEVDTSDILSGDEFRGFWIRYENDMLDVGKEGEAEPFLSFRDEDDNLTNNVKHIGVCTGWGATGEWIIEFAGTAPPASAVQSSGSHVWADVVDGVLPPDAVVGGQDHDETLYIGRANHEGNLIPGKINPNHKVLYIPWNGEEIAKEEYQVLCNCEAIWVPATAETIPPNALACGETNDGELLFVGRADHNGTLTPGKIHVSHGSMYMPYGGQEIAFREFEVLTVN